MVRRIIRQEAARPYGAIGKLAIITPGARFAPLYSYRSSPMTTLDNVAAGTILRVRVFVDFWNFDLSMRQRGFYAEGYKVDWSSLGPSLARLAGDVVDSAAPAVYRGMNVYGSYDPYSDRDAGLRRWMANTVGTFPGVSTVMMPRRRRGLPVCPSCHTEVHFARCGNVAPICAVPRKKALIRILPPT